jgi:hypothetical protein
MCGVGSGDREAAEELRATLEPEVRAFLAEHEGGRVGTTMDGKVAIGLYAEDEATRPHAEGFAASLRVRYGEAIEVTVYPYRPRLAAS